MAVRWQSCRHAGRQAVIKAGRLCVTCLICLDYASVVVVLIGQALVQGGFILHPLPLQFTDYTASQPLEDGST